MSSYPTSPSQFRNSYSGRPRRKRSYNDLDGDHQSQHFRTEDDSRPSRQYSGPNNKLRQVRNTLRSHHDTVQYASFSLTGTFLVTSSRDNTAKLWHSAASPGEPLRCLDTLRHPHKVFQCFTSENGSRVVTACADGMVRVWSRKKGVEDTEFIVIRRREYRNARACQISSDGNYVVASFYSGIRTPISRSRTRFTSSFNSCVVMQHISGRQILFDIPICGKVDQCRMSSSGSVIALGISGVIPAETMARGCSVIILDRAGNQRGIFRDVLPNENTCTKWDLSPSGDRLAMLSRDQRSVEVYEGDIEFGWKNTSISLSARDSRPYGLCRFAEGGKYVITVVGTIQAEWKSVRVFSIRKRTVLYEIPYVLQRSYPISIEPAMKFGYDADGQYERIRMVCKVVGDADAKTVDLVTSMYTVEPSANPSQTSTESSDHDCRKRDSVGRSKRDDSQYSDEQRNEFRNGPSRVDLNRLNREPTRLKSRPEQTGNQCDVPQSYKNDKTRNQMGTLDSFPQEHLPELHVARRGGHNGTTENSAHRDPYTVSVPMESGNAGMSRSIMSKYDDNRGVSSATREKKVIPCSVRAPDLPSTEKSGIGPNGSHPTSSDLGRGDIVATPASGLLSRDPRIRAKSILKNKSKVDYNSLPVTSGDPSPIAIISSASSLGSSSYTTPQNREEPPSKRTKRVSFEDKNCHSGTNLLKTTEQNSSTGEHKPSDSGPKSDVATSIVTKVTAVAAFRKERVPESLTGGNTEDNSANKRGSSSADGSLEEGELPSIPHRDMPDKSNISGRGKRLATAESLSLWTSKDPLVTTEDAAISTPTQKGSDATTSNAGNVLGRPDFLVHMPLTEKHVSDSRENQFGSAGSPEDHIPIAQLPRRRAARRKKTNTKDRGKTVAVPLRRARTVRKNVQNVDRLQTLEIRKSTNSKEQASVCVGGESQTRAKSDSEAATLCPHEKDIQVNGVDLLSEVHEAVRQNESFVSGSTLQESSPVSPPDEVVSCDINEGVSGYIEEEHIDGNESIPVTVDRFRGNRHEKHSVLRFGTQAGNTETAIPKLGAGKRGVDVNMERKAGSSKHEPLDGTVDKQKSMNEVSSNAEGGALLMVTNMKRPEYDNTGEHTSGMSENAVQSEDIFSMLQRKARLAFDSTADRVSTSGQQYITGAQAYRTIGDLLKESLLWMQEKEVARIVYGKTGSDNICTEAMFVQVFCELYREAQSNRRPQLERIFEEALPDGEKALLAFHAGDLLKQALGLSGGTSFAHWTDSDLVDVFVAEGCGMLVDVEAFVRGAEKVICGSLGRDVDIREGLAST